MLRFDAFNHDEKKNNRESENLRSSFQKLLMKNNKNRLPQLGSSTNHLIDIQIKKKYVGLPTGPHITYEKMFIYLNFYLLINLNNLVLRVFLPILLHLGDNHFWSKIPSLEEEQKGQIGKSRLMEKTDGVLDPKYESLCVFNS
jgi:hypothetical protein